MSYHVVMFFFPPLWFYFFFFVFFSVWSLKSSTSSSWFLNKTEPTIQPWMALHTYQPNNHKHNLLAKFQTTRAEPSGPPQEVKCFSPSSTSILVNWRPPAVELQNGIITQYTILYTANEGEDTATTRQISSIPPESSQYLLENLEKWTEYHVRVIAHTDVGAGPESVPQLVRTEEDGMCSQTKQSPGWTSSLLPFHLPPSITNIFACYLQFTLLFYSSLPASNCPLFWTQKLQLTLQKHIFLTFFPHNAAQFQHMVWHFHLLACNFQYQLSFF